jgi:hypothetical protein
MTTETDTTIYKRDPRQLFPYSARPLKIVRQAPKAILRSDKARGDTDTILTFESPTDFAAHAYGVATTSAFNDIAGSWEDNESLQSACQKIVKGDNKRVPMSDKLLSKMEEVHAPRTKYAYVHDVAGSKVDIGRFLAGDPLNMKRRTKRPTDQAPLAIIADVTVSAGITAEQQAARGAAVLALVRALSDIRPVTLYAFSGLEAANGGIYSVIRMDTSPLDLARASFMLQSAAMLRRTAFAIADGYGFHGGWPYRATHGGGHDKDSPLYRDHVHAILAGTVPEEQFLYVAGGYLHDKHTPNLDTNPELWLTDMLRQFGDPLAEEEGHSFEGAHGA